MQFLTLARAVALTVLLILGAAAFDLPRFLVSTARAAEATSASEADMTFFYKNPSPAGVARLMAYFDELIVSNRPNVQPAIIGFLAGAFRTYPIDIGKMVPPGLSAGTLRVVAISLRLAGQDAKARSIVDHLRRSGAVVPDLGRVPSSLEAIAATGPSEFDMLWGASFATGDPRYCSTILERFAAVANVDGNAEEMLAIAKSFGTGADLHWIVEKRGADQARELIRTSAALWALNSNARRHEFVRTVVHDYEKAHPAQPASKALLALARAG